MRKEKLGTNYLEKLFTLFRASHHILVFCCNTRHSMAMSYSIVLGWEQCDVDTAFLFLIEITRQIFTKIDAIGNKFFWQSKDLAKHILPSLRVAFEI